MEKKLRVAFIYKPSNPFLTGKHFDNNYYYFFMHALKRNSSIEVTYFPSENYFDASKLKNSFDIILLPDHLGLSIPENIEGIKDLSIPVIACTSDSHNVVNFDPIACHTKYKIDYYFSTLHKNYFYKFLPKEFKYKTIMFGIEPQFFKNLKPFHERIKDKILNSGAATNPTLKSRIVKKIFAKNKSAWDYYKLRTLCNRLPYIHYEGIKDGKYQNSYSEYLSQFRASIAATTLYPSLKYLIIPAAGCLTFMEITPLNNGYFLGFEDEKTAIIINEKNYKKRFEEFLNDPDNPKWEKIANDGRNFALENYTNDKGVEKLVQLMQSLV